MKSQKEIWRKVKWQKVKESREKYFIVYNPINIIDTNYAILDLYFTKDLSLEEIVYIMEYELRIWINKYPVPTIVYPIDKTENAISVGSVREGDFLLGYVDNASKSITNTWGNFEKLLYSKHLKYISDERLNTIYSGLAFKTIDEVIQESNEEVNTKRTTKKIIDLYFFSWLAVSILILVVGFKSYSVGVLAFLYSLYKLYKKTRSFKGHKTGKQLENAKKNRKMEQYFYHCELNPEGFLRLTRENFEKMSQDKIRKQK